MRTFFFKTIAITVLVISVFVSGSVTYAQLDIGDNSGLNGGGNDVGNNSGLTSGGQDFGQNSGLQLGGTSEIGSGLDRPTLSVPGIILWFVGLLNYIVILILTASLVVFLYGVFKLSFVDGTNPEAMAKSRKFMLWGIVSLFVMVSVWGLVNILKTSIFGNGSLILPQLK